VAVSLICLPSMLLVTLLFFAVGDDDDVFGVYCCVMLKKTAQIPFSCF
jgi:hypothetical protein